MTVNNKMYTMQGKCYLGVHADADRDQCKEKNKTKQAYYWVWVVDPCMCVDLLCMHAYVLHVNTD